MQRLRFYDTTLRDGLRNSGVEIGLPDRVRFARQLEALGVDAVEVGFGGPSQVDAMAALAEALPRTAAFGLTRPHRRDRERVFRALEGAAMPGVNVFSPVSERFLGHMGWSRSQALRRVSEAIRHAGQHMARVMLSLQDASGADPGFAVEMITAAIDGGADAISISDTTSHALPAEFGALCRSLRERTPGAGTVCWSVHCHNDLGLAVANCLAAVHEGARQVECTVGGVGEGAGNAPLERVARAILTRRDAFPELEVTLDPDALDATGALLAEVCRPADAGHSDVVGLLQRWRRSPPPTPA